MIERTGRVQVTLNAPRAPVVMGLVLAVIPGDENVLIVQNKTMKDRLGIDVMACLNRTAITGLRQNSEDESRETVAQQAMTGTSECEEHAVIRKIGVSMNESQAAAEVAAGLRWKRDEIHEELASKRPAMLWTRRRS